MLILLLLLLLHSFLLLRTELIGLLVQCSTVALYLLDDVATSVSVTPKIRSFPKLFLGTVENVAPELNLEIVVSSTPVQLPETLFHLIFTTLLTPVLSENNSRVYF